MEIQRFGLYRILPEVECAYGVLTTQLQAKSCRAKPLNIHLKIFGVVLHIISLIRVELEFVLSFLVN